MKFLEALKAKIDFKNNKVRHIIGLVILALQLVSSIVLIVYMNMLNVLPDGLYAIIICGLVIALLVNVGLNITKKLHILGKIIGVLATIVICIGCYYLHYAVNMLQSITDEHYDVDNYLVVTLADSEIDDITDIAGKEIGLAENGGDADVMAAVKAELESRAGGAMTYKTYEDMSFLISALFDGEVEVIVYMEAYDAILEEVMDYFAGSVKVIDSIEVKTLITENITKPSEDEAEEPSSEEATTEEQSTEADNLNQNVNKYDPALDPNAAGGGGYIGGDNTKDNSAKGPITDRAFNVYISGIDRYGKVSGKSRSDVNILMTVNPMTKEIILTNTPRDYYVPIPGITTGTWRDKLTHAGIYGVWYSVATLENIYDVEIDYYVRVNFTSFIYIIDVLGGVDVYSAYTFTSGGYNFTKGMNTIPNGRMALVFARERYAFAAGDNQRGRNHMAIIEGVINKAMSPALLTNFVDIVNTISTSLQTNMTMDEITALAKMQLEDGASWTIKQQYVTGTGAMRKCYSWRSTNLSVQLPNQDSIDACRAVIKSLLAKTVEKEEPTTDDTSTSETTTVQEPTSSTENPSVNESAKPEETTSNSETTSTEEATSTEGTTSSEETTSEDDTDAETSSDERKSPDDSSEIEPAA